MNPFRNRTCPNNFRFQDWLQPLELITMAQSQQISDCETSEFGLPVFHAAGKTGKWQLAAPCATSFRSGMEWALYRSQSRWRDSGARRSGGILQPRVRHQLWLGASRAPVGCGPVRRLLAPWTERSIRFRIEPRPSASLCLRTSPQTRRTRQPRI
jgi:hypothetical protein